MAMTFTAVLKITCYHYMNVSQIFDSLFLYGLIDWIFEGSPIRNGGRRGLDGRYYIGMGERGCSKCMCVRWGEGVKFLLLWCIHTN